MHTVKVSPKYQVVIPAAIRELLDIQPGQQVQMIVYENRIELLPLKTAKELRGFLKGIDTTVERENDRL